MGIMGVFTAIDAPAFRRLPTGKYCSCSIATPVQLYSCTVYEYSSWTLQLFEYIGKSMPTSRILSESALCIDLHVQAVLDLVARSS